MRKNAAEAVKWYRKAAEQGLAQAQNNLADCYANGTGMAKDEIEAYAYFKTAGTTDEEARKNLTELEGGMPEGDRLLGQQRTKELQKAIEAIIAIRKKGEANK